MPGFNIMVNAEVILLAVYVNFANNCFSQSFHCAYNPTYFYTCIFLILSLPSNIAMIFSKSLFQRLFPSFVCVYRGLAWHELQTMQMKYSNQRLTNLSHLFISTTVIQAARFFLTMCVTNPISLAIARVVAL